MKLALCVLLVCFSVNGFSVASAQPVSRHASVRSDCKPHLHDKRWYICEGSRHIEYRPGMRPDDRQRPARGQGGVLARERARTHQTVETEGTTDRVYRNGDVNRITSTEKVERYRSERGFHDSSIYIGAKSGAMEINAGGIDPGQPIGVVLGFGKREFAFEFEISDTAAALDSEGQSYDVDYSTRGFFLVWRKGFNAYTKYKIGFTREHYDSEVEAFTDNAVSIGIGLGLRYGDISVEGEYTFIEEDVQFISLGMNLTFKPM